MSEYFIYLISVLGTVAFCSFVSYGGESARYTRFVLGAILLSALTAPTVDFFKDFSLSDFSIGGSVVGESYTDEVLEEAYAEGIARAVADEFSFSVSSVSVRCDGFSVSSVSAEFIYVTLTENAAFGDARRVRSYVTDNFGECEVNLRFD